MWRPVRTFKRRGVGLLFLGEPGSERRPGASPAAWLPTERTVALVRGSSSADVIVMSARLARGRERPDHFGSTKSRQSYLIFVHLQTREGARQPEVFLQTFTLRELTTFFGICAHFRIPGTSFSLWFPGFSLTSASACVAIAFPSSFHNSRLLDLAGHDRW